MINLKIYYLQVRDQSYTFASQHVDNILKTSEARMNGKRIPVILTAMILCLTPWPVHAQPSLIDELEALTRIPSVTGRELPAARFIQSRLGDLPVQQDRLGSLTLTIGSGTPRRLLAAPMDEPGYVVSRIQEDGYLRIAPAGRSFRSNGTLAHQYHEGQKVAITTANGMIIHGALTVPSTHLDRGLRRNPVRSDGPFKWQDGVIDIGMESDAEVEASGIRLLDPVTLIKRPTIIRGELIAAPAVQSKAACIALIDVARRLSQSRVEGTVVLAWTALEVLNGKGLDAILNTQSDPFDEAYLFSPDFGLSRTNGSLALEDGPAPGSGLLIDSLFVQEAMGVTQNPMVTLFTGRFRTPALEQAVVHHLGLPARYRKTPVEMVHMSDVQLLSDMWVMVAGGDVNKKASVPPVTQEQQKTSLDLPHNDIAQMLAGLVARYGVSGSEGPVRDQIKTQLPSWMKPETDDYGNMSYTFGGGDNHIVFIAHMDETGFQVREIRDDGRLVLGPRGGFFPWLWEAQAALVHTERGDDIPAVFEPRKDAYTSENRFSPEPLTVYLGVDSRAEVEAMGIEPYSSTVTMPKQMLRIGDHRALARGFDDRAGSTALIMAAHRIDPSLVTQRITFAWSVQEEVGLIGAGELAKRIRDADIVHPVDTFVSTDTVLETQDVAYCPLGGGPVLRVLESANLTPRRNVDELIDLANARGIPFQIGMTSGGTDGGPFVSYGTPSLPISWPGRYSHSPIEVLDFRDLESLIDLITAIVTQ